MFLDAMGSVQRGIEVVEFASGAPHLLKGAISGVGRPRRRCLLAAPAGRRLRRHHAVQLPGDGAAVDVAGRAGLRQHVHPEAVGEGSVAVDPDGGAAQGGRAAGRCVQCRPWRQRGRRRDSASPGHRCRVVRRVRRPIAKYIYTTAAAAGKRVQALGGAKNHAVVLPDADIAFAADAIIGAAYGSAGERCMAISAVVAVGDAGDRLVDAAGREGAQPQGRRRASTRASTWARSSRRSIERRSWRYIDAGVAQGAELVVDGRGLAIPGHEHGFFVGPTLFDRVHAGHDDLPGRDLRSGAGRRARRLARGSA